ncbi:hypothetical protein QW131_04445 [Roseibium salinum]|nr:hypothetical protein [Roseibium salinum]
MVAALRQARTQHPSVAGDQPGNLRPHLRKKWAAEQHMLGTGTAIFVVDAAMTIHHGCREGQHLLANGTLVGSGLGRRLHFHSEEAQRRFTALARVQSKGDLNVLNSWRLADQHGQSWVCRAMGMRLGGIWTKRPSGPF